MIRVRNKNTIEMSDRVMAEITFWVGNIANLDAKEEYSHQLAGLVRRKNIGENIKEDAFKLKTDLITYLDTNERVAYRAMRDAVR